MVHQLPIGAKDLLPLDVAQKRWIESRLQNVFQSWGYQRIITPTLERLETLTAGGTVQPESVIQLYGSGMDVLGLRPELTASIARAYAARLSREVTNCPQRLYYSANVFRRKSESGSPLLASLQEYYQSGVELLGGAGLLADGEILLLLAECLKQVELTNWQVILGDAGLTGTLIETFPSQYREKIRHCLAHLDRIQLENLEIPDAVKERALQLIDLRGRPQAVLARLSTFAWASELSNAINHVKSLVDLLESAGFANALVLDLSLVQTFDYYTGIVFEVVCENHVIAQGGRYDRLLGVYHPQGITYPSIGFCLNLEDLHQVLLTTLPQSTQTTDYLVVPCTPQATHLAFVHADQLRTSAERPSVELELAFRSEQLIRDYARSRGIKQIAWVRDGEAIALEKL
ncbi:ATP phosphoribosyltransferase regulatory subunit [Tumidithrix elongata RA019]|uniref:ATP phosphoribosyltransferase regulatory subunit n=1 Tax=Tumidithrix elongata BACA0141 TaxID=2716417 RepID=A0AAW9Q3L7_9CYAN|nr:ATP phosphoribosyltransferase regulatory subunit [Tumidithrix elongata RA019]